uniref:Adenine DNA glycosylase n=1 Tax=Trypanosoma congolense (strain IL3000) TaxID=1068625 RepID=F9WJ75_TRYCI|nr:unnamed protein product [Trypanosoma congolense IL3000]
MERHYSDIQQLVVEWFRNYQRRDLPWRQPPPPANGGKGSAEGFTPVSDPYHVWVSEVMSQQTQMDTVIIYFKRWVSLFPDIPTLAQASEESVKAAWSGLGYYRRAMYLRKGAEYVMQHFSGKLPNTAAQLRKIPGIGLYSSASIASICFNEKIVSVDGNVIRVLSRLRGVRDFDPKCSKNVKVVFNWGQEIMKEGSCDRPGDFNQGLMELGARVCKPGGRPLCELCPLKPYCGAYTALMRDEIPAIEGIIPLRAKSLEKKREHIFCVVHEFCVKAAKKDASRRRFVVVQRQDGGLLGGMLEFPSKTYASMGRKNVTAQGEGPTVDLCRGLSVGRKYVTEVGPVRHVFSHIDMHVLVYHVVWLEPLSDDGEYAEKGILEDENRHPLEKVVCDALAASLCVDSSRISVMAEGQVRQAAASRLLLKILDKLTPLASGEEIQSKVVKKRSRTTKECM